MEFINDAYYIQGNKVADIANNFGTPVYVYDSQIIQNQITNLHKAFAGIDFKIKYACKALSNISILKLIKKYGCEVDAVSLEEIKLCINAGFQSSDILFTPNSISFAEIVEAAEQGVYVNIDNLYILEQFGKKYGSSVPCCVRINPHIEAGGNEKIKTGHVESKFGISVDYQERIIGIVNKYRINLTGLHIHTGSDFGDIEVFLKGMNVLFELAKKIETVKILDFGSGFKVPYKKGDKATNVAELGKKVVQAVTLFSKETGMNPQIWFEPGKYIVSEAGILLVRANVLKETPATTFVGVNSGLNHLIRPMMYGAYHHIVNVSNPTGSEQEYSVVGYICETDTFAWKRKLNEVREGDILALLNAGAYGFSMSSQYNSRPRPAEVLVHNGLPTVIRKAESFDDILRNQVIMDL